MTGGYLLKHFISLVSDGARLIWTGSCQSTMLNYLGFILAKLLRFYSRFWSEDCAGVDAFTLDWGNCNSYFLPPVSLISRVLKQMILCPAYGVIVLPLWRSANFWPLLCCQYGYFIHNVTDIIDLPTNKSSYVPCQMERVHFWKY